MFGVSPDLLLRGNDFLLVQHRLTLVFASARVGGLGPLSDGLAVALRVHGAEGVGGVVAEHVVGLVATVLRILRHRISLLCCILFYILSLSQLIKQLLR